MDEFDTEIGRSDADQEILNTLMRTVSELNALLNAENETLKVFRPPQQDLIDSKSTLARFYERQMNALADRPSLQQSLSEEERESLKQELCRLDELCQANARLLRVNMEAGESVVKAIVDSAKEAANKNLHYSDLGIGERHRTPQAPSVAFNQTL